MDSEDGTRDAPPEESTGAAQEPAATGERLTIPLFPLGSVLLPGLLLPLHIFEPRYRELVADLLALPEGEVRRFGVIAIQHGRETGVDNAEALYEIGTTAEITRVDSTEDGRYGLLTVGADRFRLLALDTSRAYLQGQVELLGDPVGSVLEASALVDGVRAAFTAYVAALGASQEQEIETPSLPTEPVLLSWVVAASVIVDLAVRQRLLAEPTTASRLAAELALLRSETGMLRVTAASPAPDLTRVPQSPN